MQSSTDLCVTVQLYTQVSACCWLGFMVGDKTTTRQQDLSKLEASLAPAEAEVGAMAKADQNEKKISGTPPSPPKKPILGGQKPKWAVSPRRVCVTVLKFYRGS